MILNIYLRSSPFSHISYFLAISGFCNFFRFTQKLFHHDCSPFKSNAIFRKRSVVVSLSCEYHYFVCNVYIQFRVFPHSTFISFHTKFTLLLGCEIILCLLTQNFPKRDCSFSLSKSNHYHCFRLRSLYKRTSFY